MKTRIIYISNDDKEFETKEECEKHDKILQQKTTTTTTTTKYGEPWIIEVSEEIPWIAAQNAGHSGDIVCEAPTEWPKSFEYSLERMNRIVSCVNACAGIDDPEKEIGEMREALNMAHSNLESIKDCLGSLVHLGRMPTGGEDSGNWEDCVQSNEFANKALAKLKPFVK